MKNRNFSLLSILLIISLIAPISGSIHNAEASSMVGDDLPSASYSISGKVTDSSNKPL